MVTQRARTHLLAALLLDPPDAVGFNGFVHAALLLALALWAGDGRHTHHNGTVTGTGPRGGWRARPHSHTRTADSSTRSRFWSARSLDTYAIW